MALFSNTISLLERSLDYSSLKQQVISQNIANADTPNYKAKDVNFKSVLNSEMEKTLPTYMTNSKHIPFQTSSESFTITKKNVQYNNNGNSVDIDQEMSDLADNQIYYNALIERLNGKFQTLQTVIKGGSQ
ncbi:flagellar basal body rod protein FlgB [Caldibacillus lycopersici]|uniref:Flagellar basal body rod protein FlgB n=1 Tax=Perspicuibacillus lycopersici TaxID=1325689 RepID=A0AAE3IPC9_9BACI|nr:flagellar basal body rod protein FlgB [Perspicuibacillus lycopersici]MCU9612110.1 flagellar basal body rod protein FlgB [Perspicuibacillus lycopersici]